MGNGVTSWVRRWIGGDYRGSEVAGSATPAPAPGLHGRGVWVVDLVRGCAREMAHDRAFEMAAALTYRTIFGLVPTFILALVVFNAFGGFQAKGQQIENQIAEFLGLNVQMAVGPGDSAAATAGDRGDRAERGDRGHDKELREQFTNILEDLTRKVSSKHYGDIGAAGLVLLVWAGIGLLVTIERSFNRIYDCPTGRPWVSRVVIYWAVLTLGPVLLFVSLYLTGVVTHELRLTHMPMLGQLTWVPALLASWLLLFLLYLLMPNTKVHTRSALVGSLVTAALYETTKVGFQLYVHEAVPYAKLYGSLGLIPLFLFWLYLTWIIVLGGLELTYALQAMRGRTFKYLRAHGEGILAGDPLWVVPLMVALGRAFTAGKTPTVMELSGATGIPMSAVMELVRRLERAGLVHRVLRAGARDVTLALSVPADKIELTRLLDVGAAAGTGSAARELARRPGNALLAKLADAQRRAVGDATLASLLAEK